MNLAASISTLACCMVFAACTGAYVIMGLKTRAALHAFVAVVLCVFILAQMGA